MCFVPYKFEKKQTVPHVILQIVLDYSKNAVIVIIMRSSAENKSILKTKVALIYVRLNVYSSFINTVK